jgi:hypothetical protein
LYAFEEVPVSGICMNPDYDETKSSIHYNLFVKFVQYNSMNDLVMFHETSTMQVACLHEYIGPFMLFIFLQCQLSALKRRDKDRQFCCEGTQHDVTRSMFSA